VNEVKSYIIQSNNKPEFPVDPSGCNYIMNIIGIVTDTSFIDEKPYAGENWYWVTPWNAAGFGVRSEAIMVVSTKTAGQ
jgi:hypothetical protein